MLLLTAHKRKLRQFTHSYFNPQPDLCTQSLFLHLLTSQRRVLQRRNNSCNKVQKCRSSAVYFPLSYQQRKAHLSAPSNAPLRNVFSSPMHLAANSLQERESMTIDRARRKRDPEVSDPFATTFSPSQQTPIVVLTNNFISLLQCLQMQYTQECFRFT